MSASRRIYVDSDSYCKSYVTIVVQDSQNLVDPEKYSRLIICPFTKSCAQWPIDKVQFQLGAAVPQ